MTEDKKEETAPEPEQSEEIPGGVQTTDPSFADGAQEVEEWSNKPTEESEEK